MLNNSYHREDFEVNKHRTNEENIFVFVFLDAVVQLNVQVWRPRLLELPDSLEEDRNRHVGITSPVIVVPDDVKLCVVNQDSDDVIFDLRARSKLFRFLRKKWHLRLSLIHTVELKNCKDFRVTLAFFSFPPEIHALPAKRDAMLHP